ncbi:MAG TPA: DUF748 domain-containing protein [Verrucomicrobiae bacterium]
MHRKFDIHSICRGIYRPSKWILIVIIVLAGVRLALPYAVKTYVNHELKQAHDYTGKIGNVSLRLWRGGYRINQLEILKRNGEVPVPFFSARQIDFAIEWRELFHGAVVGQAVLRQPRLNFTTGSSEQQKQNGKDEPWGKMLQDLFPFKLNRVEISNGEIHFQDLSSTPPVNIYLSQLSATATNLTNARDLKQKLPAGLSASGSTLGGGQLNLQLQMNLLTAQPTYEINCGLTNVQLTALNDYMRAYGKFDVQRGLFAIYASVASNNGAYEGYFKVFLNELKIFAWEKERKKDVLEIFWQAIVSGTAAIFTNHPRDQLATKIPISGSYANSNIGVWTAVATLLQNAFIHALTPKLDQHVMVEQVENPDGKK